MWCQQSELHRNTEQNCQTGLPSCQPPQYQRLYCKPTPPRRTVVSALKWTFVSCRQTLQETRMKLFWPKINSSFTCHTASPVYSCSSVFWDVCVSWNYYYFFFFDNRHLSRTDNLVTRDFFESTHHRHRSTYHPLISARALMIVFRQNMPKIFRATLWINLEVKFDAWLQNFRWKQKCYVLLFGSSLWNLINYHINTNPACY